MKNIVVWDVIRLIGFVFVVLIMPIVLLVMSILDNRKLSKKYKKMKLWSTEMQVLNQQTKELVWVEGMRVKAFTREKAQAILDKFDYHYLVLGDEIVAEIPCKPGTKDPDWNKMIDYENIQNN